VEISALNFGGDGNQKSSESNFRAQAPVNPFLIGGSSTQPSNPFVVNTTAAVPFIPPRAVTVNPFLPNTGTQIVNPFLNT